MELNEKTKPFGAKVKIGPEELEVRGVLSLLEGFVRNQREINLVGTGEEPILRAVATNPGSPSNFVSVSAAKVVAVVGVKGPESAAGFISRVEAFSLIATAKDGPGFTTVKACDRSGVIKITAE